MKVGKAVKEGVLAYLSRKTSTATNSTQAPLGVKPLESLLLLVCDLGHVMQRVLCFSLLSKMEITIIPTSEGGYEDSVE